MLYTSFKNYDEFKELFVRTNDNGKTCRKNGILLAFIKSKKVRDFLRTEYPRVQIGSINTMACLYNLLDKLVRVENADASYRVVMMNTPYYSNKYQTDDADGICTELTYKQNGEPDYSFFRYQNMEREGRVFKMKVGKMYRHLIDITRLGEVLPESVKLYMCEEITRKWEAYYASRVPAGLVLHVDDDFEAIYDGTGRCEGSFGSCMQKRHGEHWMFYRDSVNAKAAYLTRDEGDDSPIVARCVIFTEVTREDTGEVIRIAERQYSLDGDEMLKRILITKLIEGGYIDAYKKAGAGCGESRAFVDINGNDMYSVRMHTECTIKSGDHLAYQDSFKWVNTDDEIAYNYKRCDCAGRLDETDEYFENDGKWSDYYEEYIPEDEAAYVETRDDYFWSSRVVEGYVYNSYSADFDREYIFEDDAIEIDGYWYYAGDNARYPEDNGLIRCDRCGDYMPCNESCHSDITDEDYCCENCMEEAEEEYKESYWYYSDADEEYFEHRDEVTEWYHEFEDGEYLSETISVKSLEQLAAHGQAIYHDGSYYSVNALREAMDYAA